MAIKITYRRTRRMSMRVVSNGDLHISAPYGTPKVYVQKFIEDNSDWIKNALRRQLETNNKRANFYGQLPLETREQAKDATLKLHGIISPMLQKYTKLMGVNYTKLVYKPTISRWGACNKKTGEINFSLYLLLLPEFCIEHVVVHELAHLLEANHGKRFYAIMDQFFPRWKEARKLTRAMVVSSSTNFTK